MFDTEAYIHYWCWWALLKEEIVFGDFSLGIMYNAHNSVAHVNYL